ncbi:MraY family glycosyltransferase [Rhizobium sp. NFR03]|uniref:MraY family glycosyltransferase n=1 Tax=Rhizobium sp. NFR03 TaxID=1566263 RepID=UPI0008BE888B|nr:MraY family glycosyltransferase [Rhizobium sp. NFR03]SES42109.1 UDP-GlcNAc:undecaprenyl-phosphate GlcNAc-1-phosphate transferase [Rhizobium sp. NFR03]
MSWMLLETGATFLLGVIFVATGRRLCVAFGLVDRPDFARKRHRGSIPLCGGVAIFATFACASQLGPGSSLLSVPFWLGLALIVGIGVLDDRLSLSAGGRLTVQLLVSILIAGSLQTGSLSFGVLDLPDTVVLLPVLFLICVVFMTGLINAWNMLDGIDGLAGGTAAVSLVWLIVIATFAGMPDLIRSLETLLVCICAFLVFNMRSPWRARASVFLGDAGSTALGMVIACAILMIATASPVVSFSALLWVVFLPIADTLSLIVRRILAGRSPMSADRWHLHHLLLDHGLTTSSATHTLMIVSALCGGIGYAGIRLGIAGEIMAAALVLPICLHTLFVLVSTGYLTRTRLVHLRAKARSAASGHDVLGARAPVGAFTHVGEADRDA